MSDSEGEPVSVAVKVTVNIPGPLVSSGVQMNAPVAGSKVAPEGRPVAVKTIVLAGISGSAVSNVNVSSEPSLTVWAL